MNYLQLVNDLLTESSLGDEVGSINLDTFEGRKSALWIRDAYVEIQRARLWKFRWAEGTLTTTIGKNINTLADFGLTSGASVVPKEFYLVDSEGIRINLQFVEYHLIKSKKRMSVDLGGPAYITESPNGNLELYPSPDAEYAIEFEYFAAPIYLTSAEQVPTLPEQYHKAIVWKALENYARDEGGEWKGLYQTAIRNYNAIYKQIVNTQLPPVKKGG